MGNILKAGKSLIGLSVLAALIASVLRPHDTVSLITFFLASYTPWDYASSELYSDYMKTEWEKLPEIDAEPLIEFTTANFSRENLLSLSKNLAVPVVIRGALLGNPATEQWGREYFLGNFSSETIVVREVIDDGDGHPIYRMQQRSFEDFYRMSDKGRNVSVIGSSSIFYRNKELIADIRAQMEDDLVGPDGSPILANQFFITSGGRTWFHAEVGANVFRQIAGQKRWTLISPEYNFYMCPRPVISGTSVEPHCLMQMTTDEREAHIKRIPRVTALLNPGDVLINTPWWWHDVQSTGGVDEPQLSVAGRIQVMKATIANSPMESFVAIVASLLSALKGGKGLGQTETFPLDLEQNIVDSWYRHCISLDRLDCRTPV